MISRFALGSHRYGRQQFDGRNHDPIVVTDDGLGTDMLTIEVGDATPPGHRDDDHRVVIWDGTPDTNTQDLLSTDGSSASVTIDSDLVAQSSVDRSLSGATVSIESDVVAHPRLSAILHGATAAIAARISGRPKLSGTSHGARATVTESTSVASRATVTSEGAVADVEHDAQAGPSVHVHQGVTE